MVCAAYDRIMPLCKLLGCKNEWLVGSEQADQPGSAQGKEEQAQHTGEARPPCSMPFAPCPLNLLRLTHSMTSHRHRQCTAAFLTGIGCLKRLQE